MVHSFLHRFRDLERMPYKPGVDEHDYRPDRKGPPHKCFPVKFQRGNIVHHGYVSDSSERWAGPLAQREEWH